VADITLLDFNEGHENLGMAELERASRSFGHGVSRVDVRRGGSLPENPQAVLTSGGPGSPMEDGPWTVPLLGWLSRQVSREIPILGICYGYQMLARALGGSLVQLEASRFGIESIQPTKAGESDPWLSQGIPSDAFFQHAWAIEAAGHPLALGVNGDVTASRFGPTVVGCIFHPEARPGAVQQWIQIPRVAEKIADRLDAAELHALESRIPRLEQAHTGLLMEFLSCLP